METEARMYYERFGSIPLRSVFFGGGTPTTLTLNGTRRLVALIRRWFHVEPCIEWTIEANPESLTPERLAVYSELGINRLSLGIQSIEPVELDMLGRNHTQHAIPSLKQRVTSAGFSSVNLDFMFGMRDQTIEALNRSIDWAIEWNPSHISTYALSIEPGTVYAKTGMSTVNDDVQVDMMRLIQKRLMAAGFWHYETSAFCKPGFESQHNLAYWHYSPYIGLGPSAASFFDMMAYKQVSSLDRYCDNPTPPVMSHHTPIDGATLKEHYLIANLRRMSGVTFSEIMDNLGYNPWSNDDPNIQKLRANAYLSSDLDRLQLTPRGLEIMTLILEELL